MSPGPTAGPTISQVVNLALLLWVLILMTKFIQLLYLAPVDPCP